MVQLGYKATDKAPGAGIMLDGTTRASILGSFQQAVWLRRFTFWGGRTDSGTAWVQPGIWSVSGSSLGALKWSGATRAVTTHMNGANPGRTGTNYTQEISNVLVLPGEKLGAGLFNDGPGRLTYGQDLKGHPLHYDVGRPIPNPFTATQVSNQGKMTILLEGVPNVAPDRPVVSSPSNDGQTTDTTPTVVFVAKDANAVDGDYVTQFRVELYNGSGTSRLHDSGWDPSGWASAAEAAADGHQLQYTLPSQSMGQQFQLRVTTKDRAGVASQPATVRFSIVSAGVLEAVATSGKIGSVDGVDVLNTATPSMGGRWEHPSGTSAQSIEFRIVKHDTDEVYRGPYTEVLTVPDGTLLSRNFAAPEPDWAPLEAGSQAYRVEMRGIDVNGGVGPWSPSTPFRVNSAPYVFLKSPGNAITVSELPTFIAWLRDGNDGQEALRDVGFRIEHIATGESTVLSAKYVGGEETFLPNWQQATDLITLINKTVFFGDVDHGYGDYRWRVEAEDPWGVPLSDDWRTFTYAEPPDVTITSPANGAEVTVGNPTITATADRTLSKYRLRIFETSGSGIQRWDSGEVDVASSGLSVPVPAGALPNHRGYRISLWVRASDGLESTVESLFDMDIAPPAAVTNVAIETVESSEMDLPQHMLPGQQPNVQISWTPVSTGTVSNADWLEYFVKRVSEEGPSAEWTFTDRNRSTFTDTTPAGGVRHHYYFGYRRRINAGIDVIESIAVKRTIDIEVLYTTITSEDPDDPAVTLHYWQDRRVDPTTDVELVEVFGLAAPVAFQGDRGYDVIEGTFESIDADDGSWTARDVVERLRLLRLADGLDLVEQIIDYLRRLFGGEAEGPRPRLLVYRDPKKRSVPVVITRGPAEDDTYNLDWAVYGVQFTQVSRWSQQLVSVPDDEDVIDITP